MNIVCRKLKKWQWAVLALVVLVGGPSVYVDRIMVIADHAGQETSAISFNVAMSMFEITLTYLSHLANAHRDVNTYRVGLLRHLDSMNPPKPQFQYRAVLYDALTTINLCETKEGREMLAISDEDLPKAGALLRLLVSPSEGRLLIVEGARGFHAALALPPGKRSEKLDAANAKFWRGMLAFPTAAYITEALGNIPNSDYFDHIETRWQARQLLYRALARALEPREPPTSIKTDNDRRGRGPCRGRRPDRVEGPACPVSARNPSRLAKGPTFIIN